MYSPIMLFKLSVPFLYMLVLMKAIGFLLIVHVHNMYMYLYTYRKYMALLFLFRGERRLNSFPIASQFISNLQIPNAVHDQVDGRAENGQCDADVEQVEDVGVVDELGCRDLVHVDDGGRVRQPAQSKDEDSDGSYLRSFCFDTSTSFLSHDGIEQANIAHHILPGSHQVFSGFRCPRLSVSRVNCEELLRFIDFI